MAWRLADYVVRGQIDSSRKGEVTGEVWLMGLDVPISLRLSGLPCPDLAGCKLEFSVTGPIKMLPADITTSLAKEQIGKVGDITASRKCKVPTVSEEEFDRLYLARMEIPMVWKNIIYLEWYSQRNGRVVIELPAAEWTVDTPRWRMTDEEIAQRDEESARAITGFMDHLAEAYEQERQRIREAEERIEPEADDEHSWEQRLKASDERTDALMEALDQCKNAEEMEQVFDRLMPDSSSQDWEECGENCDAGDSEVYSKELNLDDHPELSELFRELASCAKGDLLQSLKGDAEIGSDCTVLCVKIRTIADLALNEVDGLEIGYFIALVKREIARCQSMLTKMAEESQADELRTLVSAVRDLLIRISGCLRSHQ